MKKKLDAYNILKLDAQHIVSNYGFKTEQNSDGNWKTIFCYDLSQSYVYNNIVAVEEKQLDNALFWQLKQIILKETDKTFNKQEKEDLLRESLVYIDFGNLFNNLVNLDENFENKGYKSKSRKELESNEGLEYRLQWLFDPDNGIQLSFNGETWKKFVPFDKSSSMARASQITFIDEELKNKVDKRLLLDLDFSKTSVVSSKFYAYRGLYLSTGYRIEPNETEFELNEDSVIVVEDHELTIKGVPVFTAEPTTLNNDDEASNSKDVLWQKSNASVIDFKVNAFDGEGLICPEFADYINAELNKYKIKESNSFQIRMPFVKGVLHTVNFHEFFKEELKDDNGQPLTDNLKVIDIYGKERSLNKAKIILTRSMFKCSKWVKLILENTSDDYIKYYFDKMKVYGHALYVTNIDTRLTGDGRVPLNYQFLSTLAISSADFESICQEQIETIEAVPETIVKKEDWQNDGVDSSQDKEDNPFKYQKQVLTAEDKCLMALTKNNAFYSEQKIKQLINTMLHTEAKNLGTGRLKVAGEQRFLSGDLLELLIHIGFKTNNPIIKKQLQTLRKQDLNPDHFYMPEKTLKLKADKYYCLLRNPHLSRNEQCLLKPYIPKEGSNSLYQKYFSKLTGIIMVGCRSTVPMALGGADFDGDLVKIVGDKRIVDAVKCGGTYTPAETNRKLLKRSTNYPVIKIPSGKNPPGETDQGCITYKTVKNTFSNHIGRISNIAVAYAKKEYTDPNVCMEEDKLKCCAGCTIVTGLEIDAAKTGMHPKVNIKLMEEEFENKKDSFLKAKDAIKSIPANRSLQIKEDKKNNTYSLHITKADTKGVDGLTNIPFYNENDNPSMNIDRLPGLFLNCLLKGTKSTAKEIPLKNTIKFNFEENRNWKRLLDPEKKEKVAALINAYTDIRTLAKNFEDKRKASKNTTYWGHILSLLAFQYDDLSDALPTTNEKIIDALEKTYAAVQSNFSTVTDVEKAIERMKAIKWHYVRGEERKEKIIDILGSKTESLEDDSVKLLTNFHNNGFKILPFILADIKNEFDKNVDIDTFVTQIAETPKEETNLEGYNEMFDAYRKEFYRKELYEPFRKSRKRKQPDWKPKVIELCRQRLSDIFEGDMSEALKYVYACEPSHYFLWDVCNAEEIMNALENPFTETTQSTTRETMPSCAKFDNLSEDNLLE